jgi:hypothetical protein
MLANWEEIKIRCSGRIHNINYNIDKSKYAKHILDNRQKCGTADDVVDGNNPKGTNCGL